EADLTQVVLQRCAADDPVVHGARRLPADDLLADGEAASMDGADRAEAVRRRDALLLETDVLAEEPAEGDVISERVADSLRRGVEALLDEDLGHRIGALSNVVDVVNRV